MRGDALPGDRDRARDRVARLRARRDAVVQGFRRVRRRCSSPSSRASWSSAGSATATGSAASPRCSCTGSCSAAPGSGPRSAAPSRRRRHDGSSCPERRSSASGCCSINAFNVYVTSQARRGAGRYVRCARDRRGVAVLALPGRPARRRLGGSERDARRSTAQGGGDRRMTSGPTSRRATSRHRREVVTLVDEAYERYRGERRRVECSHVYPALAVASR